MIFVISTTDGSTRFRCEAGDLDTALKLMAQSQGYTTYEALCRDLNYNGSDFSVAVLSEQLGEVSDNRADLNRQRDNVVSSAFRFARRTG